MEPVEKLCVVAQTTQDTLLFAKIARLLKGKADECRVFDTICSSTKKRQEETRGIARSVDAVIVVGGRNSANTVRLADICRREGTTVYHIERPEEVDAIPMSTFTRVGITAGASTPDWVIEEVRLKVETLLGG
jgi:4-hydroxy-3-methylbut-2-enyl diphosphate reductase